jgi:hypothetical protein
MLMASHLEFTLRTIIRTRRRKMRRRGETE